MPYGIRPAGYRLPDESRVGCVSLQVSDLERSLRFYRDVLGFAIVEKSPTHASLGAGTRPLIGLAAGAAGPLRQRRLGLYHFAVLLPERPALGRFVRHLVDAGFVPGASDHLVSEALYLSDPDGLGIEVYRDRPRSEWRNNGQELAMATEPLDLSDLMRSAGDGRWEGMPDGTVIGHVHLHVGALEAAKAFYHTAVGLDLVVWSYPGALFLSAGGYHHHLGLNTWAGPTAQAPGAREPKLREWELVLPTVDSVADVAASLRARGFGVVAEQTGDAVVADPWSTMLRLTASY